MTKQTKECTGSWYTITIEDDAMRFDRVGIDGMTAFERARSLRHHNTEAYPVLPPDEDDVFEDGPFAVIQMIGEKGIVRCAGLSFEDAKETADTSLANYGPGKQQETRTESTGPNGRTLVLVSRPLVIWAAYVVNLTTGESWEAESN
ncbi:hypothetical protein ACYFX5_03640 [Bremerella sp. T1]|uniref:hypothetical protein n=1 Tax=Bremerella sp. TYQ1 TaxID=3119568 RepID=UPI001CCB1637|nr:hypothetical protein [Bremerella volcania]UBM37364.1 hypothetical protein LA756_05595 [Bremerella volcania]